MLYSSVFLNISKSGIENVHPFGGLPPKRATAVTRFRDVCFQVCFPINLTKKHTLSSPDRSVSIFVVLRKSH